MQPNMRVLIYDIETSPNLGYIWGKYEQNVIEYVSEWYLLCFAYKWLDEKTTHVVALPDFKLYRKEPDNDREVVKRLHGLFEEADVVIAHNGNSFDQKKSQARMLYHGLAPPAPYRQIDTKLVARRYFNFNSNKLDDLGEVLGVGKKLETGGFATWKGCMNGEDKAWRKMKRYNKQDVVLLEQIYLKLLPWISNHPNRGMYQMEDCCPKCGSTDIQSRGWQINQTTRYRRFRCRTCGGWGKYQKNEQTKRPLSSV